MPRLPGEIKVLLVDDHPVVREGLRTVLTHEVGVRLIGEASNAADALRMLAEERVDVVLMDVQLPGMGGLEAAREVRRVAPETAVVLLTMYDSPMYLVEAIRAGAHGYVLKDASQDLIITALRAALQGGMVVPGALVRTAIDGLSGMSRRTGSEGGPASHLSSRELEVLRHLARGKPNKAIASEMCLAEVTVKKYVQSLMAKLGAADRTEAALQAVRMGLAE